MCGYVIIIVDASHWLNEDGALPADSPLLYRRALRMAQFIEYGGTLQPGEMRETLVQCSKRPKRKRCCGLMWVTKTPGLQPLAPNILAFCMACGNEEMLISNWHGTVWADGMMDPLPAHAPPDAGLH